jgi:hypothetical protein
VVDGGNLVDMVTVVGVVALVGLGEQHVDCVENAKPLEIDGKDGPKFACDIIGRKQALMWKLMKKSSSWTIANGVYALY